MNPSGVEATQSVASTPTRLGMRPPIWLSNTAGDNFSARNSRFYGNDRSGRNTHNDTGDRSSGILHREDDILGAFSNYRDHTGNGDDTLARKQEL